jgi:hypothetical protein
MGIRAIPLRLGEVARAARWYMLRSGISPRALRKLYLRFAARLSIGLGISGGQNRSKTRADQASLDGDEQCEQNDRFDRGHNVGLNSRAIALVSVVISSACMRAAGAPYVPSAPTSRRRAESGFAALARDGFGRRKTQ